MNIISYMSLIKDEINGTKLKPRTKAMIGELFKTILNGGIYKTFFEDIGKDQELELKKLGFLVTRRDHDGKVFTRIGGDF